jgi:hypothetical protein
MVEADRRILIAERKGVDSPLPAAISGAEIVTPPFREEPVQVALPKVPHSTLIQLIRTCLPRRACHL